MTDSDDILAPEVRAAFPASGVTEHPRSEFATPLLTTEQLYKLLTSGTGTMTYERFCEVCHIERDAYAEEKYWELQRVVRHMANFPRDFLRLLAEDWLANRAS